MQVKDHHPDDEPSPRDWRPAQRGCRVRPTARCGTHKGACLRVAPCNQKAGTCAGESSADDNVVSQKGHATFAACGKLVGVESEPGGPPLYAPGWHGDFHRRPAMRNWVWVTKRYKRVPNPHIPGTYSFKPSKRGWIARTNLHCPHTGETLHDISCSADAAATASTNCPVGTAGCNADDFDDDEMNDAFWSSEGSETGPEAAEEDGALAVSLPAESMGDSTSGAFVGGYESVCTIHGDFDLQVDYRLTTWPAENGARVTLRAGSYEVQRASLGMSEFIGAPRETYLTVFAPAEGPAGFIDATETSGKLRLTRVGATLTGYYFAGSDWIPIHSAAVGTGPLPIALEASSTNDTFAHQDVGAEFDNFVVDNGHVCCGTSCFSRVSVSSTKTQANGGSTLYSMSPDARFVAFTSDASNLVPGDGNGVPDVFVRDLTTGTTERISVSSGGDEGNRDSLGGRISSDGRFVAFVSYASNIIPGDTASSTPVDCFVHDRLTGQTDRVSVPYAGGQPNGNSWDRRISVDGRYVAFASYANNLVPGDTNGVPDMFLYDRMLGVAERVNVASNGAQANHEDTVAHMRAVMSADARFVGFTSDASNLVPDDTNGVLDVFVRDRVAGSTERVSVSSNGIQANAGTSSIAMSADGRFVAFVSDADNLVLDDTNHAADVFLRDRLTGTTVRVSVASNGAEADADSLSTAISPDGRLVAFASAASNLGGDGSGQVSVFVHDRGTGTTERALTTGDSNFAMSADGRVFAFESGLSDLVPDDTNAVGDVFVNIQP